MQYRDIHVRVVVDDLSVLHTQRGIERHHIGARHDVGVGHHVILGHHEARAHETAATRLRVAEHMDDGGAQALYELPVLDLNARGFDLNGGLIRPR